MYSLWQILIASSRQAEEFEEVIVDKGYAILGDIHIDHTNKYVIAASAYKVCISQQIRLAFIDRIYLS